MKLGVYVPPTATSKNATGVIVNEETRIDTIIIILWVTGGVLLIALLIMLFCLLKSKRKGGRSINRRPSLFHIDSRGGYPRSGGVNHGFTNYDEIWTWIPVIRGNQEQCHPSTRVTRTPSTASTLHREPPPYSVATAGRNGQTPASSIINTQNSGNPVSTVVRSQNTLTLIPSNLSGDNCLATSASNDINSANPLVSSNGIRLLSNDLTNRRDQRLSNPIPDNMRGRQSLGKDVRSPHSSRRHSNQHRHSDNNQQRHYSNDQHQINANSNYNAQSDDLNHTVGNGNAIANRTGNGNAFLHTDSHAARSFEYDPEEGIYSYITGTDGRRAWCDIPPTLLDEDGPPPYTPPPDYPGRRRFYPNNLRSSNRSAPLMRLDYDYF